MIPEIYTHNNEQVDNAEEPVNNESINNEPINSEGQISDQEMEDSMKESKRNEAFCPNCAKLNVREDEKSEWIDLMDSFVFTCINCNGTYEIVERERQIITTEKLVE